MNKRKGFIPSAETRLKMRLAKLGRKLTPEHKEKIRLKTIGNKSRTGQKQTEKEKEKHRQWAIKNKLGYWNLGKKTPEEVKIKMRGRVKELSPNWKGKNASYTAKHHFLHFHFGKACKCENINCVYPRSTYRKTENGKRISSRIFKPGYFLCRTVLKPKRFEWALIRGKEYSHNREDYMIMEL